MRKNILSLVALAFFGASVGLVLIAQTDSSIAYIEGNTSASELGFLQTGKVLGESKYCYTTNGVEVCRTQSKQRMYFNTPHDEVSYDAQILRRGQDDYVTIYHSEGLGKGRGNGAIQAGDSLSMGKSNNAETMSANRQYIVWPTYTDEQSTLYTDKIDGSKAYSGGGNPMTVLGNDGYYYTFFLSVANDSPKGVIPNGLRPPKVSVPLTVRHYLGVIKTQNFSEFYIWNTQKKWQLYNLATCPEINTPASCRPLPVKDTAGDFLRSHRALTADNTQGLIGSIAHVNGKYYMFYVDDDPTETRPVTDFKVGYKLYYRWTTDITNMESWSPAKEITSEILARGTLVKIAKAQNMKRWVVVYQCSNGSTPDLCIQYTSNLNVTASDGPGGLASIVYDTYNASPYALHLTVAGDSAFNQQHFLTDQDGNFVSPDSEPHSGMLTWTIFNTRACAWIGCPIYGGQIWSTTWDATDRTSPPTVFIDLPYASSTVSGNLLVAGWAIDNEKRSETAITSVKVYVDGNFFGDADYNAIRPDVCGVYPGRPNCPKVGYGYLLDTTKLADGSHRIEVRATDSDASPQTGAYGISVRVANKISPAPATPVTPVVVPVSDPAIVSFSVTPSTVTKGQSAILSWNITGAKSVSINNGIGTLTGTSKTVIADVNTIYTITAINSVGKVVTKSASMTVVPPVITPTPSPVITPTTPAPVQTPAVITIPTAYIDIPSPNKTVSGVQTVAGWAIDNIQKIGSAISNVKVYLDGTLIGDAVYGANRPDVCAAYPKRINCPYVGYNFSFDTTKFSNGNHKIEVRATDSDSPAQTGTTAVYVVIANTTTPIITPTPSPVITPTTPAPVQTPAVITIPTAYIDIPSPNKTVSGVQTVAGWAIDNIQKIGSAISNVKVYLDGTLIGDAVYGANRPDVCAAYPKRINCPYVGYNFSFDTTKFSNGNHKIEVRATDSDSPAQTGTTAVYVVIANTTTPVIISPAPPIVITYPKQVIINEESVKVELQPLDFLNGKWRYAFYWTRPVDAKGSLYIYPYPGSSPIVSQASVASSGSLTTDYVFSPYSIFRLDFYGSENSIGPALVRRYFISIKKP